MKKLILMIFLILSINLVSATTMKFVSFEDFGSTYKLTFQNMGTGTTSNQVLPEGGSGVIHFGVGEHRDFFIYSVESQIIRVDTQGNGFHDIEVKPGHMFALISDQEQIEGVSEDIFKGTLKEVDVKIHDQVKTTPEIGKDEFLTIVGKNSPPQDVVVAANLASYIAKNHLVTFRGVNDFQFYNKYELNDLNDRFVIIINDEEKYAVSIKGKGDENLYNKIEFDVADHLAKERGYVTYIFFSDRPYTGHAFVWDNTWEGKAYDPEVGDIVETKGKLVVEEVGGNIPEKYPEDYVLSMKDFLFEDLENYLEKEEPIVEKEKEEQEISNEEIIVKTTQQKQDDGVVEEQENNKQNNVQDTKPDTEIEEVKKETKSNPIKRFFGWLSSITGFAFLS